DPIDREVTIEKLRDHRSIETSGVGISKQTLRRHLSADFGALEVDKARQLGAGLHHDLVARAVIGQRHIAKISSPVELDHFGGSAGARNRRWNWSDRHRW